MEYLPHATPASTLAPRPGFRLVHNHITPAAWQGAWGFRFWWQPDDSETPPLVKCECSWAPALPEHYRVQRESSAA
jgi:hypothetical protein